MTEKSIPVVNLCAAFKRRIDRIGAWLTEHGHYRIAEWMWRTCRMW